MRCPVGSVDLLPTGLLCKERKFNKGVDTIYVMNLAAGAVDLTSGRLVWHLEARLDVRGIDLYAKKQVTVNLRD